MALPRKTMNLLCMSGATSMSEVLGREDAEQLDPERLRAQIVVAVRQRHLAPVDLHLYPDAVRCRAAGG